VKLKAALAALILASVFAACAALAETSSASGGADSGLATLTLRTSDGLALVDGSLELVEELRSRLELEPFPPVTNRQLFAWMTANGAVAENIRLFARGGAAADSSPSALRWRKTTVRKAILAGDAPYILGRPLYEAYMAIRASGARMFLIDSPAAINGVSDFPRTIFIFSSAYGDGMHGIYVDGADKSPHSNGYNVVAFDGKSGKVTETGGFNMFIGPEEGERMEGFLRALPAGSYAAVSIKWGSGPFMTPGVESALSEFGSRQSLDPEMLISHAMFGGKIPGAEAEEAAAVNLGSKVVLFGAGDRLSESDIAAGSVPGPGRALAISGTRPDDAVYILEEIR